jgi:hypothetical protein
MRSTQFHCCLLGCVIALCAGCCDGPVPLQSCADGTCPRCLPPPRWSPGTYGHQATRWQMWPDDCPDKAPAETQPLVAEPLTQRGSLEKPVTLARLPSLPPSPAVFPSALLGPAPLPAPAPAPAASLAIADQRLAAHDPPPITPTIKPESTAAAGAGWSPRKPTTVASLTPEVLPAKFEQPSPPVSAWKAAVVRRWEND